MIGIRNIRPNVLVWWTANRYMRGWSCPCVVSQVDKERAHFKVFSLDDFKETEWLKLHNPKGPHQDRSSRHEMRLCTFKEMKKYLDARARELHEAADKAMAEYLGFTRNARRFLQKHGSKSVPKKA